MTDTIKKRMAYLGVSELDKSFDNKRRVIININDAVPLVTVNEQVFNANKITEVITVQPVTLLNPLVDADDINRYLYVTNVISAITNNIVHIYYDYKYKDIIIIPDTVYLGTGSLTDASKHSTYEISGYCVSGGGNAGMHATNIPLDPAFNMPVPNTKIASKHIAVMLGGMGALASTRYTNRELSSHQTYTLSDNRNLPSGLIDIGLATDVFVANGKVPIHNLYQYTPDLYKLKYLGNHEVTKFYILLDF